MADKAWQRASTLSGGQQQRVAIARALTQRARVLLADEPIASLDPESSRIVMDILAQIHREDKITVVVSLHQVEYAIRYCPRTIALRHGRIVYDGPSTALTPSFLKEIYGSESEELFSPAVDNAMRHQPKSNQPNPPRRPPRHNDHPHFTRSRECFANFVACSSFWRFLASRTFRRTQRKSTSASFPPKRP
jgi:phosphonate transport system ATP-binding protein